MSGKRAFLLVALAIWTSLPALAQVSHFVSPTYANLARQAGIFGQVELKVKVSKDGSILAVSGSPAHPLLAQEAKACVKEWKFQPGSEERTISVTFDYRFSDTMRDNPRTLVQADFAQSGIHVVVTTDPPPPNPGTVPREK